MVYLCGNLNPICSRLSRWLLISPKKLSQTHYRISSRKTLKVCFKILWFRLKLLNLFTFLCSMLVSSTSFAVLGRQSVVNFLFFSVSLRTKSRAKKHLRQKFNLQQKIRNQLLGSGFLLDLTSLAYYLSLKLSFVCVEHQQNSNFLPQRFNKRCCRE